MHFKDERGKHLMVHSSAGGEGIYLDLPHAHHAKSPAVSWQLLLS